MKEEKKTFKELIGGETPVLVDFYADWCGPCHAMKPILSELADKMKEKVQIIKIDVDQNQQAAFAYQVQSIPTLILFHKGKILWRQAGVIPAKQLESVIISKTSQSV